MNKIKHRIKVTGYIYLVTFFCFIPSLTNAQSFNVVGCKAPYETRVMTVFDNKLIHCGFDTVCNVHVEGIGKWNNISWVKFGGLNESSGGASLAFTTYQNQLYTGGDFLTIGGKITNKIARWNGIQWDSVGKGLDDQHPVEKINALAVYKNELYVGGRFRQVDGITGYQQIAVWNGINWRKIGGLQGSIPWVECMAVYKNELYVGGVFAKAGFSNVNFIARWNGTAWSSVGKGTNARVMAMVVDTIRNILYVTGDFDRVHDTIKCRVAAWDGSNWSAVGNDTIFPTNVNTLEMYHGYLYGGGAQRFPQIEETLLARWDGNAWEPIPSFNGYIKTLKTYKDELYIGGGFTKINNDSIPYLARYYSPDSVLIGINQKEKVKKVLEVYPNPTENILHIKSDEAFQKYIVIDSQGKICLEIQNPKSKSIDISKLAKGTYIIQAFSEEVDSYTTQFIKSN